MTKKMPEPEPGDEIIIRENTFGDGAPTHIGPGNQINIYLKSTFAVVVGAAIIVGATVWQPWKASGSGTRAVHARLSLTTPNANAVIPKPLTALGSPPVFSRAQVQDHCPAWWAHWFVQQGAAQMGGPLIEVSAPAKADATITGASVKIYKAYRPAAASLIQCLHGAGPTPGTLLNVNLDRPSARPTIVSDLGREVPMAMPDAVININPGHTEYVVVAPAGSDKLYEWAVKLRVVVDQRTQVYSFGSASSPLRSWLGPQPARAYDYDTATRSWHSGL
jgi:hypothetical protein